MVGELAGHLELSLQEQALDLNLAEEEVHGLHRLEDALERHPVGEQTDDSATNGERPRVIVEEPHPSLDAPEQKAEDEARVDQKLELFAAAPLKQLHERSLILTHLPHHQFLQVHHPVHLPL